MQYALTVILKSDLSDKDRQEVLDNLVKRLPKVEKEEAWGARDLAYPIKKQKKGYYMHYLFTAQPSEIASLDKALKMEEDILRFLLVRI